MLTLPPGIDPAKPAGKLTEDELQRIAASVNATRRWDATSDEAKSANGRAMARKRWGSATAKQRRAATRKATAASVAARKARSQGD